MIQGVFVMLLPKVLTYNFTQVFCKEHVLPAPYKSVHSLSSPSAFQDSYHTVSTTAPSKKAIYLVYFIPIFMKVQLHDLLQHHRKMTFNFLPGFMCDLNGFTNTTAYITQQLGKKRSKDLLKRKSRLETCFDIEYTYYYGAIDQSTYLKLMHQLRKMIEKRFLEKGETHSGLAQWEFYTNTLYQKILDKKALLFVISDRQRPIAITVDYREAHILESGMSSYETDYSKFELGHITLLKKIEWCFEHRITLFNLGYGDYPYKRRWCTTIFEYQNHVIYNPKSWKNTLSASLIVAKNKVVAYGIRHKSSFRRLFHLRATILRCIGKGNTATPKLETTPYKELLETDALRRKKQIEIALTDENYAYLRRFMYTFQYQTITSFETIRLFKIQDEDIYRLVSPKKSVYFSV